MQVVYDTNSRKLWLCQKSYIEKMAASFNLYQSKKTYTPMFMDNLPSNTQQATTQETHEYQSHIRSLLFAAVIIWPDVTRAASKFSEHLQNLSLDHLTATDQCISYLYSTRNLVIEYSASCNYQEVTMAIAPREIFDNSTDASFTNNPDR